jgi:membrane protease YdiL (CAAX protease family)
MAHYANKKYSYLGQAGLLTLCIGVGIILGSLLSFLPLIDKVDLFSATKETMEKMMDKLFVPKNAGALRMMQFISTFFIMFLPPVVYAWICHRKTFQHLGFQKTLPLRELGLTIAIMLTCLPIVAGLQELTEMLPWSKATLAAFNAAEVTYNKQVTAMARMDNFGDYLISLSVIALLPALFEEVLFRGAIQNLLSRAIKSPIVAIIITSIVFSAIHGSYLGFLSRFALGFVLGWVYYRTGNIWLSICGHFLNNGLAITSLYLSTKPGEQVDPTKIEEHFPLWIALASLALLVFLFKLFQKETAHHEGPGEERMIEGYDDYTQPFGLGKQPTIHQD